jgi:hypothetical protein
MIVFFNQPRLQADRIERGAPSTDFGRGEFRDFLPLRSFRETPSFPVSVSRRQEDSCLPSGQDKLGC